MKTTQSDPAPESPKEIWSILGQLAERQKETEHFLRETARVLRENSEKIDRQLEENALQMKETDRRLRRAEDLFTSAWEQLVESLRRRELANLLRERGMQVTAVGVRFRSSSDPERREVDVLATTEQEAVAVLVRTMLVAEDVDEFLDLLVALPCLTQRLRGLRLYGAVAYLEGNHGTARYAARKGLFVIRATGNSASIVNPPEFRPRDFG